MESLCPAISAMAAPGNAVSMVAPSCKALHLMAARSTFASTSPSLQIQPSRSLPFSVPRRFHLICASMAPPQEKVDEAGDVAELQEKNHSLAPNSFEVQSLLMEVCDETSIAELELKVGAFKLHVKRDVGKLKGSAPAVAVAPPVPSKPMVESAISIPVAAPKSPSLSSATLLASPLSKSDSKSGLLEAAADEGLLFVTSPKVGLFRKSRIVKGKSGRPLCEEGQTVKVGQVVCYVEQLGTQQPVEAETSGEVTKILCKDGEPVGYGDPLIAIRPSFPGIK